jgi:hypothetical protein
MPNETTTPYRAVLEDLAHSRGLSGAEELVERAAEGTRGLTAAAILERPPAGYGKSLDAVLRMDDRERGRVAAAFAETFLGRSTS